MITKVTQRLILDFRDRLISEEKSKHTVNKYMRDVKGFIVFIADRALSKEEVIGYKKYLIERQYAVRSINSMLASINGFLSFIGREDCKVKTMRMQRQIYRSEEDELTKEEYLRLLKASQNKEQLNLVLQTICATGIRVSELKYFTVDAIKQGEVSVRCKNKTRIIIIPRKLCEMLVDFTKRRGIKQGAVFITKGGKPLDRSNVWAQMKALCKTAGINPQKVYPHNLRKLFARSFYDVERDIAKLADVLGHGNIETTRIYIMATGVEHREKIEMLGLVV